MGRPGYVYVNTYKLEERPKWEAEDTILHEGVPGHHLQFALAEEMENVPDFRQQLGYSAYVEGWALYSESLGTEMGFYSDPYMKYGYLSGQMWRAVRLVVDTGMHSMGWSRDQAISYSPEHRVADENGGREIDRYIVWPGQALATKPGGSRFASCAPGRNRPWAPTSTFALPRRRGGSGRDCRSIFSGIA